MKADILDSVQSDLALESAAEEFRANLKAISLLEKTAEAVEQGDMALLDEACQATELSGVSLELFDAELTKIVDKSLVYILLANDIRRIDAQVLFSGFDDIEHLHQYLDEEMLDSDPALITKLISSFASLERLVLKFSISQQSPNAFSNKLYECFLRRLADLRQSIAFLDVNATYFAY